MRNTLIAIGLLAGCGGPSANKAPYEHHETGEPAASGLKVEKVDAEEIFECQRHDLAVRIMDNGKVTDEVIVSGACEGACTAEDKAAGEAQLAEIEAAIERGESTESELDYDFTGCTFYGAELGRTDEVGGRWLAILQGHHQGAHDIPNRYYQLATELCGKVFVSAEFGTTYANRWSLEDLKVAAAGDAITVTVDNDGTPLELYTVRFPAGACAASDESVGDAEAF